MKPSFHGRSFPYLHTDEIADLLNEQAGAATWDSRKVRRWLQRSGAAIRLEDREDPTKRPCWVTTRDRLRELMPDLWSELLIRLTERTDEAA